MKRIALPLSLLALVVVAAALVLTTNSQNVTASNRDVTKKTSDTHPSRPARGTETAAHAKTGGQANLERDAGGEADHPSALGRHLEKLMQTVPGNGGEAPASSAAEW